MIQKNASLEKTIKEFKGVINTLESEKAQLENSKAVQASEITRLNEMLKKEKADAQDSSEYQQKCSELEK